MFHIGWEKVGWEYRYRLSRKLQAIKNQKNEKQKKTIHSRDETFKSQLKKKHRKMEGKNIKTTWLEKIDNMKDYIFKSHCFVVY